jgi:pimeloyl-ACP methyl ester carboxylesterase
MPKIELNGAKIAYAEAGAGETVLLLHGTAGSSAQWRSLTDMLRSGCHVVAPDLYGYGESDPWPGNGSFSLAEEVALARAVLPLLRGPIHLVGYSYGGAVALRFAFQHPERLRSLTLIEPVAFHLLRDDSQDPGDARLVDEVMDIAALISQAAVTGSYQSAMAHFIDYWNGPGAWQHTKPELQNALVRRVPKVALDFWATITESTPRAAYREIGAPTLILRGTHSPRPTRRIAEVLADCLPNARLRTIERAGHLLPLTHKEAVNAAVAEHLSRNMAGGRRSVAA